MSLPEEVKSIETALRDAGLSLDPILRTADVDRSTWTRWKNGSVRGARYDTLAKVKAAVAAAVEAASAKAAA